MTTALLVIDFQEGVVADAANVLAVRDNINALIARARATGTPLVFVQHHDDELIRDTPAWQLREDLAYVPGDHLVEKTFTDSFAGTTLDEVLKAQGATHLVIAGAQSNWCVNAAARSALVHGYDVTLVADAHTTSDVELPSGTLTGQQIIDYTNLHFHWLGYPGRQVGAATTADITFA